TAFAGAVDTALMLQRRDQRRSLYSIQRYGDDLPEITLLLDAENRTISAGVSVRESEQNAVANAILAWLEIQSDPAEEKLIHASVEGATANKERALRALVASERITRTGAGRRGDPYRYSVSPFLPPRYESEGEREKYGLATSAVESSAIPSSG